MNKKVTLSELPNKSLVRKIKKKKKNHIMKNFQDSKKKMMRINSRKDSQKCHVMTDKITKS